MRELTEKQAAVLGFIERHIAMEGRAPTIREIGASLRVDSTNGVVDHLKALERKGYIQREPGRVYGIRVLRTLEGGEPATVALEAWREENRRLRALLSRLCGFVEAGRVPPTLLADVQAATRGLA
jgi:SOS-response transcriptional repressor LexA